MVCEDFRERNYSFSIVHANDHQEGLLTLEISRRLRAKSIIFLRSPGMTRDDYFKYRCNKFDVICAIGEELTARVAAWDSGKKIHAIFDGIFEDEFLPPKPKPDHAPNRALVIGSPLVWKGWADMTAALLLLQEQKALPDLRFDFTGDWPDESENPLALDSSSKSRCNFLGRRENFRELVRSYDLVINPSRMETFGMAAVEVLAAGVPLLSSRSGVIEQIITDREFLFHPNDPAGLAFVLRNVLDRWTTVDFNLPAVQARIRDRFMIGHATDHLDAMLSELSV